jgi:hypothetical protein
MSTGAARPGRAGSGRPLDEEGERGLGHGFLEAGEAPSQRVPRSRGNRQTESLRDRVEIVRPDRPTQKPTRRGGAACDPLAEGTGGRLAIVHHCHQLDVRVPERNDPVSGAPARVAAAAGRLQPVARLKALGGCGQILHRDQDMVELHRHRG